MSPSKKANKQASANEAQSAQKKPSVRSVSRTRARVEGTSLESHNRLEVQKEAQGISSNVRMNILRLVALLAVIGITFYIYSIRERVEQFEQYGYPGIFLITLLANATILLPAPGAAIVYAMGAVFHPLGVGLAAGTGGALGELSGYLAGFSGQAIIERTDVYERIKPWVQKYGGWTILVLSAVPNPFFDAAGIAAGIAKMPLRTFLFFVWIGQIIKMTLFAYAGRYSLEWLAQFF